MSVECPRCKQPLYLEVVSTQIFALAEVTFLDVKTSEMVDRDRTYQLKCMNCDFKGWLDKYHDERDGVVALFDREGKLRCECYSKQSEPKSEK